jgi:site-specific DNA recombinase
MRPHRVLGYCRVSSREQADRTSLDTQKAALERFCAERGYPKPIIRIEVESGSAERAEARAKQRALLEDVRVGDMVLVLDQDRWSRDTIHFLSSADEIRRRGGTLTSVVGGTSVDSPEERLTATQRAAFAEYERRRIMQRSERGMRHLHELGFHVYGRAPLGYRLVARRLVVDPEGADVVRQIFAWCLEGLGVHEIAYRYRATFPGLRGSDHALMARRLHDRTYLGEAPRDPRDPLTDWVAGRHEAIVDEATFARAQESLRGRAHGGRRANPKGLGGVFLGAGMIRCAHCGHVMSCTKAGHDGTITHDGWYACHYSRRGCVAPRARRDHVDAELERLILERIESVQAELAKEAIVVRKVERVVDELGPVRRARQRLVDAIADGTLTREQARAKLLELDERERVAIVREQDRKQHAERERPEIRAARLADVETIRRLWRRLGVPKRREAMQTLVKSVTIRSTRTKRRWERGAWKIEIEWS